MAVAIVTFPMSSICRTVQGILVGSGGLFRLYSTMLAIPVNECTEWDRDSYTYGSEIRV